MTIAIIILTVIIVLAVILTVANYNSLVKLRNRTYNAWGQTEVQLQKRYDLIPNLVEIVKGYAGHEAAVLEQIVRLRSAWEDVKTVDDKCSLNNELASALKSVMAVVENYPELKANESFILLQKQLRDVEEQIAFSRQFYNDTVTRYNMKLELFPSNIFARMFGFTAASLFQTESAQAKSNVNVKF